MTNDTETPTVAAPQAKVCDIDRCQRPVRARGLCGAHHERRRRYGDPLHPHGRGQDGQAPTPCRFCGASIAPRRGKAAPNYCTDACRCRAYRTRRMGDLRERVLRGLRL